MTEAQIKAIEARESAATPGPWDDFSTCNICDELHLKRNAAKRNEHNGHHATEEDFVFIAAARTDVPALVVEVRRLRRLIYDAAPLTTTGPSGSRPRDLHSPCPWCNRYPCETAPGGHAADCPAFTPDGAVK